MKHNNPDGTCDATPQQRGDPGASMRRLTFWPPRSSRRTNHKTLWWLKQKVKHITKPPVSDSFHKIEPCRTVKTSLPCFIGVNLKSGRYFRSLALLAVFLNCPSALDVSYLTKSQGNGSACVQWRMLAVTKQAGFSTCIICIIWAQLVNGNS